MACPPLGSPNAPASTPRRPTSRSASPAKAVPAGPPPKASPRCSRRPAPPSRTSPNSSLPRRAGPGPAHPAHRPHPGGSRRLLRRWRLSRRSRLGPDPLPQGRRRERLCARGHRRQYAAALPRRGYLIVSPNSAPRKGDRVVLRTTDGEVMAKILIRRTAKTVELASFNAAHPISSSPLTASTAWRASCGRASTRKPEIGSRGPRMARSVTSDA
jgi:Peptidase S24-like